MNRSPRRGRVSQLPRHNDSLNRFKHGVRAKPSTGIEVLHPPLKVPGRKSRSKEKISRSKEKISCSKEKIPRSKEKIPSSKEKILRSKEKIPRSKDKTPRSKEKIPHSKEKILRSKEKILRSKEKIPRSKEKFLRSKEKIPRSKEKFLRSKEKLLATRCCYMAPEKKSFGQYFVRAESPKKYKETAVGPADDHQFQALSKYPHNLESGKSVATNLKEPKKGCRSSRNKMRSSSRCPSSGSSRSPKRALFDESHWLKLDSPEDVDRIIESKDVLTLEPPSEQMFISDVPRVKVIAEKFSKYKRGNLELRRLDEKVVCVEYDVFNQAYNHDVLKPVQKLRTFFSIKPSSDKDSKNQGLPRLPPNIQNEFDILEKNMEKLTEKEIEFIDTDIEENQSYLDDLRRILKRKEVMSTNKNKKTLDLQCLYEMAIRDGRPLKTDFSEMNLLTKAELQEVKQLILQRCTSSVHGFRRKTIKKQGPAMSPGVISDNIMSEMLQYQT